MKNQQFRFEKEGIWLVLIGALVIGISTLHYMTPTMKWQYHLILMQAYFVPILISAFQFGKRGGVAAALAVSIFYFPHIMLQWGGLVEANLMRFLQILLFNIIGYLTGLKAQQVKEEARRYQQTAVQLRASLELLRQKTDKLEEMEEQLRQADRLAIVGELSASMAHEVRNPLGSIRGTVEILRDELPEKYRQSEFFRILIEETERVNAVIENYLSISRKRPVDIKRFNLNEVLHNLSLLLNSRARKTRVKLELDIPEGELYLETDEQALRQVLINLLLNGIQSMADGGRLSLRAREEDGGGLCVEVEDEGSGMSDTELASMFNPFYTTREDGTGLGLAVVKRLSEKNRWKLDVKSEPGKGTLVRLKLPRVRNE